jgi:predicted naringenin-chalcone synthase
MRYINDIYLAPQVERWSNARLLEFFEPIIGQLPMDAAELGKLRDFVRFQLVGERWRSFRTDLGTLGDFSSRASAFESAADSALSELAQQVAPAAQSAGITFDAVISTTATGNLMPGLSYRMAQRLGGLARTDCMMIDLGNVGCTGAVKALHLARTLDPSVRHVLIVALEVPSTLANFTSTSHDAWQGNCTFGDGGAAMWVSSDPDCGSMALALEDIRYRQWSGTGLDLIRWGYHDYYSFHLRNAKTFDQDVRQFVVDALQESEAGWKDEPRWAIHPAGIVLLVRISRKLGIPSEAIQPSVAHYRENSNMSSASILHILREVAGGTPVGSSVNLLTMGAGFNVIYGRVRRAR